MARNLLFEGVRGANLAMVLTLLHRTGPRSRAELTEATGLNRSTIGKISADLVEAGLIQERAPDATNRVGRPSPVMLAHPLIVAMTVNPEVDAVTLAAVGFDGRVILHERHEMDHLATPDDVVSIVEAALLRWRSAQLSGMRVIGVGFAVPGLVRASDGLVRMAPHLEWTDVPLGPMLEAATGLPVAIGNDASLGARAEHLFGAGRGIGDLVYMNGGASGIGGGVISGGVALEGALGYAGEFGRTRPGIGRTEDHRSSDGLLEDEVARARLLDAVELSHADEPTLRAALLAADAARPPAASIELDRQRRVLATGIANAINVLNPSRVILGGFLATLAEADLEEFTEMVIARTMPTLGDGVDLRVAALGEDRLAVGAAELVFDRMLKGLGSFLERAWVSESEPSPFPRTPA